MNEQEYEKIDRALKKSIETINQKDVPLEVLEGFQKSVKDKIIEVESQGMRGRTLTPVFAIGMLFILMLLGLGVFLLLGAPKDKVTQETPTIVAKEVQLVDNSKNMDLVTEIEILRELGVWTDLDEESLGITVEDQFLEMEIVFEGDTSFNTIPTTVL